MIRILKKRGITQLNTGETVSMAMERSGGYPTKQELIMASKKERTYISFGQAHEHTIGSLILNKNVLLEIDGDEKNAGNIARLLFGQKWANLYPEDVVRSQSVFEHYPGGIVRIDGWSGKPVSKKGRLTSISVAPYGLCQGVIVVKVDTGELLTIHHYPGNAQIYAFDIETTGEVVGEFIGMGSPAVNIQVIYEE